MTVVVDDDASICRLFEALFRLIDYPCVSARTEREALDLAQKHRPRLVFLDVMMPDRSGFLIAEDIKHVVPEVTIVAMTAARSHVIDEARRWPHFSDVLRKPFDIDELCAWAERYDQPLVAA